jgi:hypothetical protein
MCFERDAEKLQTFDWTNRQPELARDRQRPETPTRAVVGPDTVSEPYRV